MKKIRNNNAGFTLMELLVAVSIFVIISVSFTQIFQMVLRSQRQTIYAQNVQENVRFSVEAMSKEIRNAFVDEEGVCTGEPGLIYNTDDGIEQGSALFFMNQYGECVEYFYVEEVADGRTTKRLKIKRYMPGEEVGGPEAYITPDDIIFFKPIFIVDNEADNATNQNKVTMVLRFLVNREGQDQEIVNSQTTISSRYYQGNINVALGICTDADGDGWFKEPSGCDDKDKDGNIDTDFEGHKDCKDDVADVYPGVSEVAGKCLDNIDNNCNGKIDCEETTCYTVPECAPLGCGLLLPFDLSGGASMPIDLCQ